MKTKVTGCLLISSVLLFVLLLPIFLTARRIAKASASSSNLRNLAFATLSYARDHEDRLPPMDTPGTFKKALFPKYIKDADTFVSPYSNKPYRPVALYSGKKLSGIGNSKDVVFLYDVPWSQKDDARFCAFLDGVVRTVRAERWRKIKDVAGSQ